MSDLTPEQVIADTVTGTTGRHSYIVGAQAAGFIMASLDAAGYVIEDKAKLESALHALREANAEIKRLNGVLARLP